MKATYIFLASLIVFIISLTQTAVFTNKGHNEVYALMCLLLGWADIFNEGTSWLANPLLFISWLCLLLKQLKFSVVSSFLASCFALFYLSADTIIVNEAGHKSSINSYGSGYYLWAASCLIVFIGSIMALKYPPKAPHAPKKL